VDTAAQEINGAEAERKRSTDIRALVREYGELAAVDQQRIDGWLDDASITAQAVRDALLVDIKAKAAGAPKVKATVGAPRADSDSRRGFQSHQDFFLSVIENHKARSRDAVNDERLRPLVVFDDEDKADELAFLMPRAFNTKTIRAAAGSDEQGTYADPYGGFAVPESTLPGMLSIPFEGDPTIGRTTMVPMATPSVKILARTDKDHTTSVSGGFTVTRRPETVDFTSSRSKMERVRLEASSLVGLAFETEELLQDSAVSFAALIDAGFRDQFAAHMLNEKIRGLGVGEYEGILTAPCKVEIAKETGQAADTINYTNVLKMRARCWGYGSSFWFTNHDCLPELAQMSLAVGTGGAPVYMPGGFGDRPDTLLGRSIFYSEYPNTLGDAGDLILWNPTQYLEGVYQPLRSAESVHVRFVQHERAFKLWLRNAGASWWRSALTPAKGSNTLSPIITLAARA
jgi:HK97 family phage major capsid protein